MTDLHQSFLDMKCPRGGNIQEFLGSLKMRQHELWAIGITIINPEFKQMMLHSILDSLSTFVAQTLNSLTIVSRYTGTSVDMSELINMVSEEANHAKTYHTPKDQTTKGKAESQNDKALAITKGNGNNRKCCKGKCHHCQKEGHWAHKCFTRKWEERQQRHRAVRPALAPTLASASASLRTSLWALPIL